MTTFKAGDRVRYSTHRYEVGQRGAGEGVVEREHGAGLYSVQVEGEPDTWPYWMTEMELIEPEPVYDINPGDRFRFTVEGVYEDSGGKGGVNVGTYDATRDFDVTSSGDDTVTIEKIEPPVVTFGPGDVVRRKRDGAPILLADRGYVYLRGGARGHYYGYDEMSYPLASFTSERYERVELAEVPF